MHPEQRKDPVKEDLGLLSFQYRSGTDMALKILLNMTDKMQKFFKVQLS